MIKLIHQQIQSIEKIALYGIREDRTISQRLGT